MSPVSYALCALARSGSWLLSYGLADTGLAGSPRPHLCGLVSGEPPTGQTRMEHAVRSAAVVRRRAAGGNGVFGLKLESADLEEASSWARADGSFMGTDAAFLLTLFPGMKFVYLVRDDKTRQALSLLRGLHTHRWMQFGESGEPPSAPAPDWARVDAIRAVLAEQEAGWLDFFAQARVRPYRVSYEALSQDLDAYRAGLRGVLNYLGIDVPAGLVIAPPRLRRQADERTEEWARQYEAWRAAAGPGDTGRRPGGETRQALRQVAAMPRRVHQMLGDGRLTLDEALRLPAPGTAKPPADPGVGQRVLRALREEA